MSPEPDRQAGGPPPASAVGGLSGVTLAIFATCAAIELALTLSDLELVEAWRLRRRVIEYAGFWPGLLADWRPNYAAQPYLMFFTYGFVHAGPVHFAINMLVLWNLGQVVSGYAGARGYAMVYGVSLLAGAIAFALLAPTLRPMVGASGALFGLFGAVMVWTYRIRKAQGASLTSYWWYLAVIFSLNIALWWAMRGQLAWETHLGGFLAGSAVAFFLRPRSA